MDNSIKDIIEELKDKYNIPKGEIERIIDSQFKVLQNVMETREVKTVNMVYLGKFKATTFLKHLKEKNKQDELVNKI